MNSEALSRPKGVSGIVGRKLTIHLGKGPDWVWNLKVVTRRRPDVQDVYDLRIFNAAEAASKRIKVKNFTSLDPRPELILFEGSYDKKENRVEIFNTTNSLNLERAA